MFAFILIQLAFEIGDAENVQPSAFESNDRPDTDAEDLTALFDACDWNLSRTARRLAVDCSTAHRRMKRSGTQKPYVQTTKIDCYESIYLRCIRLLSRRFHLELLKPFLGLGGRCDMFFCFTVAGDFARKKSREIARRAKLSWLRQLKLRFARRLCH